MPLFLLANWKWLLPGIISIGLGLALVIDTLEIAHLKQKAAEVSAERAQEKVVAETAINAANQAAADKDAHNAELASQLDSAHETAMEAINAIQADDARKFADLLRRARTGVCPSGELSASAPDSSKPSDPAARNELFDRAGRDFAELAARADKLEVYAKTCHAWAVAVGR